MSYQKAELPKPVSLSDIKIIEGFYIGKEEIEIEGHKEKSFIHSFEGVKDAKITQVWGFNMLNRYLENIPIEVLTKINYLKKIEDKKTGQSAHQCEVFFDKDIKRPANRRLPF